MLLARFPDAAPGRMRSVLGAYTDVHGAEQGRCILPGADVLQVLYHRMHAGIREPSCYGADSGSAGSGWVQGFLGGGWN